MLDSMLPVQVGMSYVIAANVIVLANHLVKLIKQ